MTAGNHSKRGLPGRNQRPLAGRCLNAYQDTAAESERVRARKRARRVSRTLLTGSLLLLLPIFIGCLGSATNEGEDYGNLLDTPEGLVLTEEEHLGGWGRAECTQCHNLANIHLVNRTDIAIDIDAIHDQALDEGNAGCPACHGTNGVP